MLAMCTRFEDKYPSSHQVVAPKVLLGWISFFEAEIWSLQVYLMPKQSKGKILSREEWPEPETLQLIMADC